jgi:CubicO group peptidase (beta-lactamase class C family)
MPNPRTASIRRRRATLVLVCLAAASSVQAANDTTARSAKPEEVGMSAQRLARIAPAMQRYIDQQLVSGVVTLVARRGKVVHFEAQGLADVAAGRPMTEDTVFRIASMTKPITSVALMMLFEEGHFLLDDPVSKFLPEFAEPQVAVPLERELTGGRTYRLAPTAGPITIRQLLTHTAGLANTYMGPFREDHDAAGERRPGETIGDFVVRLAALPLNYEPGTQWQYSRATDVVGRLVEVISGQTLDAFLRDRILAPLGMSDTHFYLPLEKLPRFAAQYRPGEDGKIVLADAPTAQSRFVAEPHNYFMGAGGMVSTAPDYLRFLLMMLNGGELEGTRLLGRKTTELMTENHIGDLPVWLRGPGFGFGLGYSVLVDRGRAGSMTSEGSYGWGGAFCTYFWVDPEEELIGILMTQVRPYNHINIRHEFENLANQAIID